MRYRFTARGHKNILSNHRNTLEFTKDADLSVDGDCIVGVSADFEPAELHRLVRDHRKLVMTISAGGVSETIEFIANENFTSSRELVLRLSEFSSDRTLGFRASKSSAMLDRKLISLLRDPAQRITVEIEPRLRIIIFDFDNTICDLKAGLDHAHKKLSELLCEKYGIYGPTAYKLLLDIDAEYSQKGFHASPQNYDRHVWFREIFKRTGIAASDNDVDEMVRTYWKLTNSASRPMPHAPNVLTQLRKNYKIAVISDSDGDKQPKIERARRTGLYGLADFWLLSDDVGINKPDKRFYSAIFDKFGAAPGQCIMVGDKPPVDLELAKTLGMSTVWIKHGRWSEAHSGDLYPYVDHEITDIRQVLEVVRQK